MSDLVERLRAGTGGGKHWMDLHEEAASTLSALQEQNKALREGLSMMTEHYVELAGCGDCGHWDPEEEEKVIEARAILAATNQEGGE